MGSGGIASWPGCFNPRKNPLVPMWQEAGWAPQLVWMQWRREEIPTPSRNNTLVIQPTA